MSELSQNAARRLIGLLEPIEWPRFQVLNNVVRCCGVPGYRNAPHITPQIGDVVSRHEIYTGETLVVAGLSNEGSPLEGLDLVSINNSFDGRLYMTHPERIDLIVTVDGRRP